MSGTPTTRGVVKFEVRDTDTEALFVIRPLPLLKGCKWMTYHLIEHSQVMRMKKKSDKTNEVRDGVGEMAGGSCVCSRGPRRG